MGFTSKQVSIVMQEPKDRIGSLAKAKYCSIKGLEYQPAEYFYSKQHELVYIVNSKCACSSIK